MSEAGGTVVGTKVRERTGDGGGQDGGKTD